MPRLTRMRVLVTGGAGFIGSHFARRLAALGDEVVVLDKLTYSGNRANLEDVEHDFHHGDIADPEAVGQAARGCDASSTGGANTYGSHQCPEMMVPLFTTNALDGEPLPVYGNGRQRREWLHVADHCSGIDLVLREGKSGEIYNIGGQERENMDVVRRILDLTGASPDLVRHVDDRPGHDRRYSIDATKLHGLGWAPKHSFESGLAETVEWYRTHRDWWEPIKSGEFRAYYERQYAARLS